ncbi:hypothetical protein B188_26880 [Candidatus Brocadiaceae bacterium B188]|nr:hypothetical protein B188_26880 [Candidatus Brocadiaceae bacterium B188]
MKRILVKTGYEEKKFPSQYSNEAKALTDKT